MSALLAIYSEDTTQELLLKPVSNAKMFDRCSAKLLKLGIIHSASACRLNIKKLRQDYKKIKDHNNKSGNDRKTSKWDERLDDLLGIDFRFGHNGVGGRSNGGFSGQRRRPRRRRGWTTIGLGNKRASARDCNSSRCSSPYPQTKRKGKRARDENFLDTVEAMETWRAVVKDTMHVEQMAQLSKAHEMEDKTLMMMERHAEVLTRQVEHQQRQDEVSARHQEHQDEVSARRQKRQERQDEVSARRQEHQDEMSARRQDRQDEVSARRQERQDEVSAQRQEHQDATRPLPGFLPTPSCWGSRRHQPLLRRG
ncbi:uncharacterized protein LOC117562757 [Gymnodraco acuticeps]|uniref:Uncharacterized protein LOC117562757 n=1 Tax=Gymnodraco acuticeps TaxID=8218 RepID=A0A6P8X8Y4_GYMAC|nr:uncharacterized protein LOC117562757 [Gymnodraco acuticeps]